METDGTYESRDTRGGAVPRPAVPPPGSAPVVPPASASHAAAFVPPPGRVPAAAPPHPGAIPPPPGHAPGRIAVADWLRIPRPVAEPGVWRLGHRPRPAEEPEEVPARRLFTGAVIALLSGWLLWSLLWNGYLGRYWLWPLLVLTPDSWRTDADTWGMAIYTYYAIVGGGFLVFFARIGHVPDIWRRYTRKKDAPVPPPPPGADPADWPEIREAGLADTAQTLAEAIRQGLLGDVDYARLRRAWHGVRTRPDRLPAFTEAVRTRGAAACGHPSGKRDLPIRTATHDLATGQVLIGTAADHPRNPYARRTTGVALEQGVLGTSLLAVGPAGSGKTTRLIRPVVESLCLQALANRAAVVAVTAHGASLGADEAFDVVVSVGRAESTHDLDLYGGTDDPDEAARILAEALVGDLVADSRRAATALAQLIGPFRAVYGRFPAVPELRELLSGTPAALDALRAAVAADPAQIRELDARQRQAERGDDIGVLLAERIAFLDRPAFAAFFATDPDARPQFSLRALEHPLRVRVDLPERGHAEASRIVSRLLLSQFTEAALGRRDRSLFACLVLDDATHTVTGEALRAVQRLRSAHAGVVLALRSLEDVPEALRGPLLGAVGCRMAFAGLAPWDGGRFADTWGTEWVQTRDVTNRQIISDEPLTKALHAMRRIVTGKATTAEAVTVREVERQRWSASDLAHAVPPGHAVLSLTHVRGEHTPPLLVELGS
ncbi:ATP-binding protein [Streptomyces sp. NBC_00094]|uniref:ATP-binding protein n=1 Tax=Streptomyces sp. NBC_00094 TaxID=2903620 RepID=UPI0022571370|nr:ATP-binding protein [Streptomyces sp. NBC_00094]MCX5393510.1 ATP-binding protein [Streptomyces sp. NBC_00094]